MYCNAEYCWSGEANVNGQGGKRQKQKSLQGTCDTQDNKTEYAFQKHATVRVNGNKCKNACQ